MKQEHISEIKAVIVLAISLILLASLITFVPEDLSWYTSHPNIPAQNLIRITGATAAGSLLFVFGYSAYAFVFFLLFWSWNKFRLRKIGFSIPKLVSFFVLVSVLSSGLSMLGPQQITLRFQRAGIIGLLFSDFLIRYVGGLGAYIILSALGSLALILTGEFLIAPLFVKGFETVQGFSERMQKKIKEEKEKFPLKPLVAVSQPRQASLKPMNIRPKSAEAAPPPKGSEPSIRITQPAKIQKEEKKREEPVPAENLSLNEEYRLPPLDLLDDPPNISTSRIENDLRSGAKLLESTLAEFGVMARVADVERGPAITRYELEPAPGVKVQKFTALSDDIALAMRATAVRVVAPIPGKNRIGIEVPNSASAAVYLKEVLASHEFRSSTSKLTLSLGKDIAGKPIVADLGEMPHLLIAGTTGSGKTVCVNGIIMSMLLNASPSDLRFLMVDPKMVELAPYSDIPHLLVPPIIDTQKASAALNWIVSEMESRYRQLSAAGVRNIHGYTAKGHKMPHIVVIIDELADLMQVSAKAVESSITRIAQLSRAVGIHLVLVTQRPSVDVITGVIKANCPARISFKVASKVDSRTVLDLNGAESLLGKGDMLFIQPGESKPMRGQCSFVKDEEISRVMRFIKDQQAPLYDDSILQHQKTGAQGGAEDQDEYYEEALRLVIETNQASVSILQRRLRLGYTRAARLIDMMEQNGIVGPYCGSKPREILVDREQWLLDHMRDKPDTHDQSSDS